MRYMIDDVIVRHASLSKVAELAERMVCGDVIVLHKETGTGWKIEVYETDEPLPRAEDEG